MNKPVFNYVAESNEKEHPHLKHTRRFAMCDKTAGTYHGMFFLYSTILSKFSIVVKEVVNRTNGRLGN